MLLGLLLRLGGSGSTQSGPARFTFLQWMLGDLLGDLALERRIEPYRLVTMLTDAQFAGALSRELERAVQAAQTALADQFIARSGRQPWGIENVLSPEALSQLAPGVHILLWVLCFEARAELGDARVVTHLLPHLTRVLQMSADAEGENLEKFTARLWLLHLRMDAGLLA